MLFTVIMIAIGMKKLRNEYDLEQFKVKEFLLLFLCLSLLRTTTYTQDRGLLLKRGTIVQTS